MSRRSLKPALARALLAAAALAAIAVLGCNAIYGIHQLSNVEDDAAAQDAAPGDARQESGDAGPDAVPPLCGSPLDGGTVTSAELEWALWPMPNSPDDVEAGAPNPQSYTDNGDGTVTDDVTGLMWQQNAATTWIQSGAINYCQGLKLAGYTDWMLPTYVELASLVDLSQSSPAIDPVHFPSAPSDVFWSSTIYVGASDLGWTVSFISGSTSNRTTSSTAIHHARCVRHPYTVVAADAGAPTCTRYLVTQLGQGATQVTDTITGLRWQSAPSKGSNASESGARAYCRMLDWAGTTGWRLPTGSELLTLVDVTATAPPLADPSAFPNLNQQAFWTASLDVGMSGYAWTVSFLSGERNAALVTPGAGVLCVR